MDDDPKITTDTPQSDSSSTDAQMILNLEPMIKNHIKIIDKAKAELSRQKGMIDDALASDSSYQEKLEEAKKITKEKSQLMSKILSSPALVPIVNKTKDLKSEIREYSVALSDYLSEFSRTSGINVIEGGDGEVREIG